MLLNDDSDSNMSTHWIITFYVPRSDLPVCTRYDYVGCDVKNDKSKLFVAKSKLEYEW